LAWLSIVLVDRQVRLRLPRSTRLPTGLAGFHRLRRWHVFRPRVPAHSMSRNGPS